LAPAPAKSCHSTGIAIVATQLTTEQISTNFVITVEITGTVLAMQIWSGLGFLAGNDHNQVRTGIN
jgi:hypothetical protein